MFKKFCLIIILIVFQASFSGCSLFKKPGVSAVTNDEFEIKPSQSVTKPSDPILKQLDSMSLDEKIGQMIISGVDGYNFNDNTKDLIDNYKIGGFIILGGNVQNTDQLLNLLNSIKKENLKNKIPLFMCVDEEGGRVTRMPKEFIKIPTNKAIGKINDKNFSYKLGCTIAGEIKAFGFNVDFAPVLDVNTNPKNPVIGDRSFGSDANLVSSLGLQTMKGIQSQNVISVIKHFPGHGDTSIDSHKGLPTVNNDLNRLQSIELVPFADAINNDADVVMVAHILLPKIDKDNPASMSKTIVTDILRNNLKFSGVAVTDDMTMGAISKNYKIGEAVVKSVNAGIDIVLVCNGHNNEVEVFNALKNAALNGNLSQQRINESVYRILSLKQKYGLKDEIVASVDVSTINNNISTVLAAYTGKK